MFKIVNVDVRGGSEKRLVLKFQTPKHLSLDHFRSTFVIEVQTADHRKPLTSRGFENQRFRIELCRVRRPDIEAYYDLISTRYTDGRNVLKSLTNLISEFGGIPKGVPTILKFSDTFNDFIDFHPGLTNYNPMVDI